MPQPIRAYTDSAGQQWLVLDNGHEIALPGSGSSTPGVADHGDLTGLADDDHSQYVLATGARPITGTQNFGANIDLMRAGANTGILWSPANRFLFIPASTGEVRVGAADSGVPVPLEIGAPTLASHGATRKHVADRERALVIEVTTTSWNDAIAPGPWPKLLHAVNNPNGPGAQSDGSAYYYYLTNYVYAGSVDEDLTGAHTRNVTQWAISYTGLAVYMRHRYASAWTAWVRVGGYPILGALTPYTGWSVGSALTLSGGVVTVEGLAERTGSTLAMTAFGTYQFATLPVGFRPSTVRHFPMVLFGGGSTSVMGYITAGSNGIVYAQPHAAISCTTNSGNIALGFSFRQAN